MKWDIEKVFKYDKVFSPNTFKYLAWAADKNDVETARKLIEVAEDVEKQYRKNYHCVNSNKTNQAFHAGDLNSKYQYFKVKDLKNPIDKYNRKQSTIGYNTITADTIDPSKIKTTNMVKRKRSGIMYFKNCPKCGENSYSSSKKR